MVNKDIRIQAVMNEEPKSQREQIAITYVK